jgi:hypothetical protein
MTSLVPTIEKKVLLLTKLLDHFGLSSCPSQKICILGNEIKLKIGPLMLTHKTNALYFSLGVEDNSQKISL